MSEKLHVTRSDLCEGRKNIPLHEVNCFDFKIALSDKMDSANKVIITGTNGISYVIKDRRGMRRWVSL